MTLNIVTTTGSRFIAGTSQPQLTATGGGPIIVAFAIVLFLVAIILSILVTVKYAKGYFETRNRPVLFLAVGMVFLAPLPMFLQLILGNAKLVSVDLRQFIVTLSKLIGLLLILKVVHRT
jgi:tellurite resistance protein TehA-like permease